VYACHPQCLVPPCPGSPWIYSPCARYSVVLNYSSTKFITRSPCAPARFHLSTIRYSTFAPNAGLVPMAGRHGTWGWEGFRSPVSLSLGLRRTPVHWSWIQRVSEHSDAFLFSTLSLEPLAERERPRSSLNTNLVCFALVSPSHYRGCSTGSLHLSAHPTLRSHRSVDVCYDRRFLILYHPSDPPSLTTLIYHLFPLRCSPEPTLGVIMAGAHNVDTTRHDLGASGP